jgi:hypothetical protein
MAPAEALRAARLKFGSVESVTESYRDQRGLPWMDALYADFRYALRGWKKTPGFTITAVAAMSLGIGTTTSIFCVVSAVALKPLGVPDPDRLVVLTTTGHQTREKVPTAQLRPRRLLGTGERRRLLSTTCRRSVPA